MQSLKQKQIQIHHQRASLAQDDLEGRGRHGRSFDVMGDLAQNAGEEGHQTRHWLVLTTLVAVLREAFGARVQYEPGDFRDYSDTRPDLAIEGMGAGGGMYLGDTKVKDPVG